MPLLDTSVLIDVSRGNRSDQGRRAQATLVQNVSQGQTLYASRLNEAEFRVGGFRSVNPARETAKIEAVLATLVILEFDSAAASSFAGLKAHLLGLGRISGDMDMLIAAVALSHNQPILTRNPRHFADVPGLVVQTY